MRLVKQYPTVAFFILAFAISWAVHIAMAVASTNAPPLKLLAEFGPAGAAFIVTWVVQGRVGARSLWGRMWLWRINPLWYVVVFLGPAALQLACMEVFVLLGHPGGQFQFPGLALLVILPILFLTCVGEETGWRGFALPRLQSRYHPVVASLLIGALWWAWHLPAYLSNPSLLQSGSTYVNAAWFAALTLTGSVLMAWVYNRTSGSILLMALFHLGLSVLQQFVTRPEQVFGPTELATILMAIIATILVASTGVKPSLHQGEGPTSAASLPVVAAQERSQ